MRVDGTTAPPHPSAGEGEGEGDGEGGSVKLDFEALAKAADYSHASHHDHPDLAQLAKANIEMDRSRATVEAGYRSVLTRLLRTDEFGAAKSDVIIGVPPPRPPEARVDVIIGAPAGRDFGWTWS
mmetsp:Transcript_25643/g.81427  ORF Transcript_25643/g.81427 Transcript_25643/m.81427 type:complete len:125 (+) Transcript_25643:2-376(+)